MNITLAPRPQRFRAPLGFIAVALTIYLVDAAIVHSPVFLEKPDVIAAAASIDLTFGVTVAWWLMVVRRGRAPARTVLPLFVASIGAAMATLPAGHRNLLHDFRYLAIPFELAAIAAIVAGVRSTNKRLAASGTQLDVPERIRAAFGDSIPPGVADVLAMEGSIFYYALASWRRKPFVPAGAAAFSYHKKNGYAGILYTLARMSLVEMIALDFLVRLRHPHAANVVLAVDLFAAVWLIGLARAVQLRPILVDGSVLRLRLGVQWTADVPIDRITQIEYTRIKAPPKRTPGYLRMAPHPNTMLSLREPIVARGPYGIERAVSRIGLSLDDIKIFQQTITV